MEISESGDEPRQACWPSRRTLGPSAPAKSLSNLPNIYKIPANDPFITVQHRRRVYRLLCCFIPFNKSHFHTVGVSANEPRSRKFPRLGSRRSASARWNFGFVPVVKVKMSKKNQSADPEPVLHGTSCTGQISGGTCAIMGDLVMGGGVQPS